MKKTIHFYFLLCLFLLPAWLLAQANENPKPLKARQTQARFLGKTLPVRELIKRAAIDPEKRNLSKKRREREVPNFEGQEQLQWTKSQGLPKGKDPLYAPQSLKSNELQLEPLLNFDGMDENTAQAIFPPDVNGEVGASYVVETINASWMQVFDKETGEALSDPISTATIWNTLNTSSIGDPVIAYDREAGRWLLIEIGDFVGNTILMAISDDEDPLGSWTAYELITPYFPDYPKLSIWKDSYIITTNEYEIPEAVLYVLNREDFLNTTAAPQMQRFELPGLGMDWGIEVATPADWDGNNPPPADALPMVLRMVDDAWGVYPEDLIEIWSMEVDWDNPNNSQLIGPVLVTPQPFDTNPCEYEGSLYTCVPGTGDAIEGLPGIATYRVQYRNFGSYQTLLFNFIADVSGNNDSGIRWMELRKEPGQEWTVYQEGIIGTEDGEHRIFGSPAMDGNGNIAIGYSVSGEQTHVATRITGRRYFDLPGEMTVQEFESATGQSPYYELRWGDYTAMVLDPQDDRTFWYFGEYAKDNNIFGTKITSFILQRDTNDIGPYALLSPQDAPLLSEQETVTLNVRNFGLDTQMVFQVGYQFENEPPVIEDVNYLLPPDSFYIHTFTPTVDMSTIGAYQFTLFTNMDTDQANFNDTLRKVVRHLPRFDASPIELLNIPAVACAEELQVSALLKNLGTDTLTSLNLYWSLNGSTPQLIEWTGSLPFEEEEEITFTVSPLQNGDNTLLVYTELPNGMQDEVQDNDSITRSIEANTNGGEVTLSLLTDDYPNETSWELFDEFGNLLYAGGPYESPQTTYTHTFCLNSNSCYTFVIYDSYGDGITYGTVSGSYQITDASGDVLASIINPAFGSQEQNDFCTSFGCFVEAEITLTNESAPGAQDGAILIEPTSGVGPFQYSIDAGLSFQSEGLFENLSGGGYSVVVIDANGCGYVEDSVIVHQCQVNIMVEVTDESSAGAMDGSIEILVSGLSIPIQFSIDGGQTFYPYSIFENLPPGTYDIAVIGAGGCEGVLNGIVVNSGPTATSSNTYGYDLQLYPNPTDGFFYLSIKGLEDTPWLKFEILDTQGRVVGQGALARYDQILEGQGSLLGLPAETYFLKFDDRRLPLQRVIKE